MSKTANIPLVKTALLPNVSTLNSNLDIIDGAVGNVENRTTDTSAAIVSTQGKVYLSKGSVGNWTLALPIAGLPSAGGNDGQRLTIISTTAFAHTVTTPASGLNGANHIATFTAAAGNCIEVSALGGVWYTTQLKGVTLS